MRSRGDIRQNFVSSHKNILSEIPRVVNDFVVIQSVDIQFLVDIVQILCYDETILQREGILCWAISCRLASRSSSLLSCWLSDSCAERSAFSTTRAFPTFALKIVGPCAIVESFCRQFDSAMLRAMGIVALLAFAAHALYAAFAYVCIRGGKEPTRRVLRYGTVFANCGYMGLPLQQVLFGADGVFYGATWIGVYNLVAWSFGLVLMSGDRRQISFKKLLLNPGILAVLTGIVIFVCSIELPTIILQPIHYFSALNVPVPMVISGYYLSKADLRTIWKHANYYITIALRLAVIPLCSIGLMFLLQKAFRLDGMLLAACIVDIAAPVAAATTMFSTLFRQDSETAANLVSISTLLSVLTLPIMVALAQSVFL